MDQPVTYAAPWWAAANASAQRSWAAASVLAALVSWPQTGAALGPAAPFVPPRALLEADETHGAAGARSSAPSARDEVSTGSGGTEVTASASSSAAPAGLAGVRLGHRPQALIDGQWWAPGSRPRGAFLVAIEKQGVWLRDGKGHREFLALSPGAAATPSPLATTELPRRTTAVSPPSTAKRTSP